MTQRQPRSQAGRRQMVVLAIFLLGALPLGRAVLGSIEDYSFWWLGLLTIAASLFGIRLPFKSESGAITVTVSDCFIFLSLFLYGVEAAVLVGALDALTVCLKVCWRSWEKILFNVGQMSLSVFLAGSLFWQTQSSAHPLEIEVSNLLPATLQILACAVVYYALSSFMIGIVVASCGEHSMGELFRNYLLKLSPSTLLGVLAALAILLPLPSLLALPMAISLMSASYLWTRRQASLALFALQD